MLTVQILINDKVIWRNSVKRISGSVQYDDELCSYRVDSGGIIYHTYDDGAVILAQKLLSHYLEEKCK